MVLPIFIIRRIPTQIYEAISYWMIFVFLFWAAGVVPEARKWPREAERGGFSGPGDDSGPISDHFWWFRARCLLLRQDRCLLLRQDRCLLLRQDRCLLLRQDRCLLVRQGAALFHYFAFVLSQEKTSVVSQQRTSVLSQEKASVLAQLKVPPNHCKKQWFWFPGTPRQHDLPPQGKAQTRVLEGVVGCQNPN